MANDDKPPVSSSSSSRTSRVSRQRPKDGAERPFDMWLQKQLHAMYDDIAGEPLPNDLLKMIDRDAAQTDGGQDGSDKGTPDGKKA